MSNPASSIASRISKGALANFIGLAIRIIEQVALVPLLLAYWSLEMFSEWVIISAVPVFLSLSDLGFITAASNELARRAQDGLEEAGRFFKDYAVAYFRWALVVAAVFIAAVALLPTARWLNLEAIAQAELVAVFAGLTAATLLSQCAALLAESLRAVHKLHVGLLLRALAAALSLIMVVSLITLFGAGPIGVAAAMGLARLVEVIVIALVVRRIGLEPSFNLFRRVTERLGPQLKLGLEFMLLPASQAIILQGGVLVCSIVLGPIAAAIFATHRTVARLTSQMMHIFVMPLRGEAVMVNSEEGREKLWAALTQVAVLTLWVSLGTSLVLIAIGGVLFQLWTGGEIAFSAALFVPLILAAVLEIQWRIASTVRFGTNQHRPLVWSYAAICLMGIALSVLLLNLMGVPGLGWVMLGVEGAMLAVSIATLTSLFDRPSGGYLRALMALPRLRP